MKPRFSLFTVVMNDRMGVVSSAMFAERTIISMVLPVPMAFRGFRSATSSLQRAGTTSA